MKFKLLSALLLVSISFTCFSQDHAKFNRKADSLYKAKNYAQAGPYYIKAAANAEYAAVKKNDYYNAACCYALAGKTDSALLLLNATPLPQASRLWFNVKTNFNAIIKFR